MPCRDVNALTPTLRTLCQEHMEACRRDGFDVFVTWTLRTPTEQAALYAQGRRPLSEVNRLRADAGLPPVTQRQNSFPVTWSQRSRHFPGPDGLGRAYDLALRNKEGLVWDPKADSDEDQIPDWEEIARLAEALGLAAGKRFGDPAHFQMRENPR